MCFSILGSRRSCSSKLGRNAWAVAQAMRRWFQDAMCESHVFVADDDHDCPHHAARPWRDLPPQAPKSSSRGQPERLYTLPLGPSPPSTLFEQIDGEPYDSFGVRFA
jgi:hypothetical protein